MKTAEQDTADSPSVKALQTARWLGLLGLVIGAAVLLFPTAAHIDDLDALLVRTVARHLNEDHTWFDLRYINGPHGQFREQLPFGFWSMAVWIRLFGEAALPFHGALFCLATLLLVWRTAARLAGEAAGALAVLCLAYPDGFYFYGASARLDPPLFCWSMAASALFLTGRARLGTWALGALLAALAASTQGPFGLVLPFAALVARAVADRSRAVLQGGAIALSLAVVPVVALVAANRLAGDGSWWHGYVLHQLLASATGGRTGGRQGVLFPLEQIARGFWPGLPVVLIGFWQALRGIGHAGMPSREARAVRVAGIFAAVAVLLLLIPRRMQADHTVVAFPALALLGGVAAGPWLERLLDRAWGRRAALGLVGVVAAIQIALVATGAGRTLPIASCPFSRELGPVLQAVRPQDGVFLVSSPASHLVTAELAGELRLDPMQVPELPVGAATFGTQWAVVQEKLLPANTGSWKLLARSDGWAVLRRSAGP